MQGVAILHGKAVADGHHAVSYTLEAEPEQVVRRSVFLRLAPTRAMALKFSGTLRVIEGCVTVRVVRLADATAESYRLVAGIGSITPAGLTIPEGHVAVIAPQAHSFVLVMASGAIEGLAPNDAQLAGNRPLLPGELPGVAAPTWRPANSLGMQL